MNRFAQVLTSLTLCFAEYERRTLYGAPVVTLDMLLRLISCGFIIIIIVSILLLKSVEAYEWRYIFRQIFMSKSHYNTISFLYALPNM